MCCTARLYQTCACVMAKWWLSLCFVDEESCHPERLQLLQKDHQQKPDKQHERESGEKSFPVLVRFVSGGRTLSKRGRSQDENKLIRLVFSSKPGSLMLAELFLLSSGNKPEASWLFLHPQLDIENEVNNEMANRMSLFYAEATPMLKTLSNATTSFVTEVRV